MSEEDKLAQVRTFLHSHKHCVIASINHESKPQSAFVAFSSNDKLEIIVGTSNKSRKYKNIVNDPHVSVVVADESGGVQYEGVAYEVDNADVAGVMAQDFAQLPGSKKYREDSTQTWFHIKPTWIRYVQHGENDIIEEMTEF